MSPSVVVGVSPTTGSPSALRWAVTEAALHGVPVHAVMAWRARLPSTPGLRPPVPPLTEPAADAEERLRAHVEAALGAGAADVRCTAVQGTAVAALLSASQDAVLLVVGEPRPGRLQSVRTSLVAPQVVLKAPCPVVVMPAVTAAVG